MPPRRKMKLLKTQRSSDWKNGESFDRRSDGDYPAQIHRSVRMGSLFQENGLSASSDSSQVQALVMAVLLMQPTVSGGRPTVVRWHSLTDQALAAALVHCAAGPLLAGCMNGMAGQLMARSTNAAAAIPRGGRRLAEACPLIAKLRIANSKIADLRRHRAETIGVPVEIWFRQPACHRRCDPTRGSGRHRSRPQSGRRLAC